MFRVIKLELVSFGLVIFERIYLSPSGKVEIVFECLNS